MGRGTKAAITDYNYLPRCGRAETLKISTDQRPGDQLSTQVLGKESIRTKWTQAGPHSEEPLKGSQCQGPNVWEVVFLLLHLPHLCP